MIEGVEIGRKAAGPKVRRYAWSPPLAEPLPPGTVVLESATDFEEFFAPLYPFLSEYAWLLESAMFATPPVWEHSYDPSLGRPRGPELDEYFGYQVAVRQFDNPGWLWLARPGFVERYAKYLVDDWCQIAGVSGFTGDGDELLRLAEVEQTCLWRLPMVEVWFSNVDAAFWQFAAKRGGLVDVVRSHVQQQADLWIREWHLGA